MKVLGDLIATLPESLRAQITGDVLYAPVLGITADSRKVKPGHLFVAISGEAKDGHAFLQQAFDAGAMGAFGQNPREDKRHYWVVPNSRHILAQLAAAFYDHPSQKMRIIGITGTSGKTTISYVMESILHAAGLPTAVIGTVNARIGKDVIPSEQTTPDPVALQAFLAQALARDCKNAIMEVSSHSLRQHRVADVAFDAMVFSNLSPEHLDYHPNMEHYFQSKAMLFRDCARYSRAYGKTPVAAVNADDPYGKRLIEELRAENLVRVTPFHPEQDLKSFHMDLEGVRGTFGTIEIRSPLPGRFNAANILAAATVARGLGIPAAAVSSGVAALLSVPGRLQRIPNPSKVHIFVDYAHKPDALEKVLQALRDARARQKKPGKILTVFGCGGNRDRTKRPVMGKIAASLSDHVWITSDNPRTEKPEVIIDEILAGTQGFKNYTVQPDRTQAITAAIEAAVPGDTVLIAGKGHEDYQILADPASPTGTRKIHFDDCEIAAQAIKNRGN